MAKIEHLY